MLYRSSAGGLCTAEYELPFSQIMEITGAGEESTCDVYVVLTGLDCSCLRRSIIMNHFCTIHSWRSFIKSITYWFGMRSGTLAYTWPSALISSPMVRRLE
jgi:hypothetical protein